MVIGFYLNVGCFFGDRKNCKEVFSLLWIFICVEDKLCIYENDIICIILLELNICYNL